MVGQHFPMKLSIPGLSFVLVLTLMVFFVPSTLAKDLPEGKKSISLVRTDGTKLKIGDVVFTPNGQSAKIKVTVDAPEFGDEFLSMRPFRCLPDTKEMWCHLEYPHSTNKEITAEDLADLEYALLFLHRSGQGYGIDFWNGLYFKLTLNQDGSLTGALNETDLNVLATPPEASTRPILPRSLTPVEPNARRFSSIEIR